MPDDIKANIREGPIKAIVLLDDPRLPDPFLKDSNYAVEDIESINILKKTLNELKNYQFSYLDQHDIFIETLVKEKPELVVNFCDGFHNQATKELHVAALLELLNIPYTGSDPIALATCNNKSLVSLIAASVNVPVPDEYYYAPLNPSIPADLSYPLLVKPNIGDGSFGLTRASLVYSQNELIEQLKVLREQYPQIPLLIQEFLSGPEYTVGLIGNVGALEVLPVIEIDYSNLAQALPKMMPYESKWEPNSPYWDHIVFKEALLSNENKMKLQSYAQTLFERTGCRDYARIDFRTDKTGQIKLLEVNPNPGLNWFSLADYADAALLDKILASASKRLGLTR